MRLRDLRFSPQGFPFAGSDTLCVLRDFVIKIFLLIYPAHVIETMP